MSTKKRLVSDEQMEQWNSFPNKLKVRQMQGAQEFLAMMDKFHLKDSLSTPYSHGSHVP